MVTMKRSHAQRFLQMLRATTGPRDWAVRLARERCYVLFTKYKAEITTNPKHATLSEDVRLCTAFNAGFSSGVKAAADEVVDAFEGVINVT